MGYLLKTCTTHGGKEKERSLTCNTKSLIFPMMVAISRKATPGYALNKRCSFACVDDMGGDFSKAVAVAKQG